MGRPVSAAEGSNPEAGGTGTWLTKSSRVGEVKILVCIKQVPDAEAPVRIGADGRSLVVGEGAWRMNRFDEFAVEEALRIREALEMPLPALITVQSGINRPRYPALSHVLRARS